METVLCTLMIVHNCRPQHKIKRACFCFVSNDNSYLRLYFINGFYFMEYSTKKKNIGKIYSRQRSQFYKTNQRKKLWLILNTAENQLLDAFKIFLVVWWQDKTKFCLLKSYIRLHLTLKVAITSLSRCLKV